MNWLRDDCRSNSQVSELTLTHKPGVGIKTQTTSTRSTSSLHVVFRLRSPPMWPDSMRPSRRKSSKVVQVTAGLHTETASHVEQGGTAALHLRRSRAALTSKLLSEVVIFAAAAAEICSSCGSVVWWRINNKSVLSKVQIWILTELFLESITFWWLHYLMNVVKHLYGQIN